ncbi:MAG: SDR family oxidoreductase [Clostridiales bacterium]|nr:SDR family oxidoreductase [Clostridiales bacterium]
MSIKGKVAVVTGGAGVLCGAFAKELARNGAKVAVLDLNKERASIVSDEINGYGGKAIAVECNVLEKESIKAAADEIRATFGTCDILVNGAGGNHPKGTTSKEFMSQEDFGDNDETTFFDLDKDGISFVFDLNFLGTLLPSQEFAKDMKDKTDATIINVSSMNAFTPLTKIPAYSAAKSAVSNFTQWLAVHMAEMGVRVNAIAPGFFVTAQNEKLLLNEDGSFTARGNKIITNTPVGRFGKPEELLGTLMWLADSEKSSFVTGTIIPVDGGFSAYSGV